MANMFKRMGIQGKILLVFTVINLIATTAYTVFVYQLREKSVLEEVDARLQVAAHALPLILPAGYLDQPVQDGLRLSEGDYVARTRSLYAYSRQAKLQYVYAFIEHNDHVVYMADAASDAEIAANKYGHYLEPYPNPPLALRQAFQDGQPQFAEYADKFGSFRSYFLPGTRKDGSRYVIGVDIDISVVQSRTREALRSSMLLGGLLFAISLALSWPLARGLARPVKDLLKVTLKIAEGDYSARAQPVGEDEIAQLAQGINTMGESITMRKEAILKQLYIDELTLLGNRPAAQDALKQALYAQHAGVLVLVHLDRFRSINYLLGYAAGDQVLQAMATRLTQLAPTHNQVYRLGSNMFALIVMGVTEETAEALYERIFHVVESEPLTINEQDIDLSITLGCVHFPLHGKQSGLLLRNAEGALYTAKQNQKRWLEYKPEHISRQRDQLSLLGELRRALEQDEIHLFFQPQVSIDTGRLVQAEALIRWSHPERGWIPPNDFIPFLEQTGRIRSLTNWVLNAVAKQVAVWRAAGEPLTVALNVAVHDLEDPEFAQRVAFALQQHQAMACDMCLEITEGGLMADPEQALITLSALHQAGHAVAVDDFGTGYSSLAHLSKLPVDELKIDRSFIMDWNPQNRSIVVSTISLGHALQMKVVAEGVETAAQYRELSALGCDIAQGYLVSKPLPLAEFNRWRAAHRDTHSWGG